MPSSIRFEVSPKLPVGAVSALKSAAWPGQDDVDYLRVLERSLAYVCAFDGDALVGFVNVAWDGGVHAFLLDTTVRVSYQRRGIGRELVRIATNEARERGCEWLHVDFGPEYAAFYEACGFEPTRAGLIALARE